MRHNSVPAKCHPERGHYANGLCEPCYKGAETKRRRGTVGGLVAKHRADRTYRLKKRYDITPEEYEVLEKAQKGLCAICHKRCSTGRRLAVDHNHKTGKVRGLLCMKCNRAIALLGESLQILLWAIAYLMRE